MDIYYTSIAQMVIESLDLVKAEPPLSKGDQKKLEILYHWALTFPGGEINKIVSSTSFVDQLVAAKIRKGLS